MDFQQIQSKIHLLYEELNNVASSDFDGFKRIKNEIAELKKEAQKVITPWDRVCLARDTSRPRAMDFIASLIDDFIELHGDYLFADDQAVVGGLGYIGKYPVTVIAQAKGKTITENIKRNFASANPEGFRKAHRLAMQAEKFKRPIITIIDTSGAYPGKGAEERGQSRAIAEDIMLFSSLNVPVISIVIGEGGSGGALALSVANKIYMLENAVYSILSPEGFSSILFKDASKFKESANKMGLTSFDLKAQGIADEIIEEGVEGINANFNSITALIKKKVISDLDSYSKKNPDAIRNERYEKFRKIGNLS